MKNKGFTIIELLVTFVIIALVGGIGVLSYNAINKSVETSYYKTLEENLLLTGNQYFETHREELPIRGSKTVSIKNLVDGKYMEPIKDKKGNACTGGSIYIYRNPETNTYSYEVCLDCGDAYKSQGIYCNGNPGEIKVDAVEYGTTTEYNTLLSYANVGVSSRSVSVTFSLKGDSDHPIVVSRYAITKANSGELFDECRNINEVSNNTCNYVFNDSGSFIVTAYSGEEKIGDEKEINLKIDKSDPTLEIESQAKYVIEDGSDKKTIDLNLNNVNDDYGISRIRYCYSDCYSSSNVKNESKWTTATNIEDGTLSIDIGSGSYTLYVEATDLSGKTVTKSKPIDIAYLIKLQYNQDYVQTFEVVYGKNYGYLSSLPTEYENRAIEWRYLNNTINDDTLVTLDREHTLTTEFNNKVTNVTAEAYCSNVTYNGENQLLTKPEPTGIIFVDNVRKDVNEEGYPITVKLVEGYVWADNNGTENRTIYCPINAASINEYQVELSNYNYTYDGNEKKPTVTSVKDDKDSVLDSSDYTVSYANNKDAGTASVIIKGTGNYSGEIVKTFTIKKAIINVPNAPSDKIYTGENQNHGISIPGGTSIVTGSSTTVAKDVGTYSVVLRLNDNKNYEWNETASPTSDKIIQWKIVAASINGYSVTLSSSSYTYDGTAKTPTVTVKNGGTVIDASNYTVTYENNTNVGTATVKITGKDNYAGQVTKTFTITKRTVQITAPEVVSGTLKYNGSNQNLLASAGSCSQGGVMYWYSSNPGTTSTAPSFNTSTWTTTAPTNYSKKDAGTYYIWYYCKVDDTNNNTGNDINKVLYKSKAIVSNQDIITITKQTFTYDGNTHSASASASSGLTPTITYYVNNNCTTQTTSANSGATSNGGAPKNANTYYVIAKTTGNNNYEAGNSVCTEAVVINKAACTLTTTAKSINTGGTVTLSTTANNAKGALSYAIKNGGSNTTTPSTISNGVLTAGAMNPNNDNTQSVDVEITDQGNENYLGCTKPVVITVQKNNNNMSAKNGTVYVNSTTALSTFVQNNTGGALSAVKGTDNEGGTKGNVNGTNFIAGTLAANDDGNKTVSLTITAARTATVKEKTVTTTVTVQKYTRALNLTVNPTTVEYQGTATLSTTNSGSDGTPSTSIVYASSNTNVFAISGNKITALTSSGTSNITATRAGSETVKAATSSVVTVTANVATCNPPRDVTVSSDGKVSFTGSNNASSYKISIANGEWKDYSGSTSYRNDIIAVAGNRTVNVKSICGTNYTPESSVATVTTTVYSVTLTKGTGIGSVTGAGRYIKGETVAINATVNNGYLWGSWKKTSGGQVVTTSQSYSGTINENWDYTASAINNTYTITIVAGHGLSKVTGTNWTNSGTTSMTKKVEQGSTISLCESTASDTKIVGTRKTGYTGCSATVSGAGTLSGNTFTVGVGEATITLKATGIETPVPTVAIASTNKIYGSSTTALSGTISNSYDSGISVTYTYFYDTSATGSYGNSQTASISATSHKGIRYYKAKAVASDGALTSSTGTSSNNVSLTLIRASYTPNVNNCGTIDSSDAKYAYKGETSLYTTNTGSTTTTWTSITAKTGYTVTGWYTQASGGSKVLNANGSLTGTAVSGYTTASAYDSIQNRTLYAQCTQNTYTINYYVGTSSIGSQTCTYGQTCNLKSFATGLNGTFPNSANGWSFYGWTNNTTKTARDYADSASFTYNLTANLNLYAVGSRNLRFSSGNAPTTNSGNKTQYWNSYGTSVSTIEVPSATAVNGWTFVGYRATNEAASTVTIGSSYAGTTTYNPGPTNLTAFDFRAIYSRTLTINYDKNGGSGTTIDASTATQYYNSGFGNGSANSGANVSSPNWSLKANTYTKDGFGFKGWGESASATSGTAPGTYTWSPAVTASATKTLYAVWGTNSYTITIKAGSGITAVALTGWTNTGTATMSKTMAYGATLDLSTISPTFKNGYSGKAYVKTSGSGTISGNTFTVGAGITTITVNASALTTPTVTISGAGEKVRNYQNLSLTCGTSTAYDSSLTKKYSFGYSTTDGGTPSSWTTESTTATYSVPKDDYTGTRYYSCKMFVTDGTLTSGTGTSAVSADAAASYINARIHFDATTNGGAISGVTSLYTAYGKTNLYSGRANTKAGTVPTATKTGYTFDGWWTAASGGSQVIAANGTVQASVSNWTDASKNWLRTSTADNTTTNVLYAHYKIVNPTAPTISGGATKVYNYQATTLTCATTSTYASGTSIYYEFGYATTSGGTVNWLGSPSTNATLSVAKNAFLGTRYYSCRVYASDGTSTSATVAGTGSTTMILQRVKVIFNATSNGGTLSGTSPLYVEYGNGTLYTAATGTTTGTMPTGTKSGNGFNGWWTAASGGSQVANTTPALTGTAVSDWTNASKQWVITTISDKTLYSQYATNSYTITIKAGNGISAVALSGWTNTGTASMSKSFAFGSTVDLSAISPTFKNGYSGKAYVKTSGSGTLSGSTFTVGAGVTTITVNATAISTPVPTVAIASTSKIYGASTTALSGTVSNGYDSGISVTYTYFYDTSATGSYGNSQTASISATSHKGIRYYKAKAVASDGTLTSSTGTSSNNVSLTLIRASYTPNANNCGTLGSSDAKYAYKGETSLYTTNTGSTTTTWTSITAKAGYTVTGWYTAASGGSKVLNANGSLAGTAVSGYTTASAYDSTQNRTLYAQCTPNTYTIAYTKNNGTCTTTPTSGTYDSDVQISNCTKTLTFKGNPNSTSGANAASGTVTIGGNTTKAQTFAGWASSSSAGLGNNAKTGTAANPTTAWAGAATKNTYFKNLKESGTVTLTAKFTAVAGTLPTVTREGYTCGWSTSSTGITITYASGATFPASAITEGMGTTVNLYAVCIRGAYSITYNLNNGSNNSNNPSSYNIESSNITLAAPTKTLTFKGNANSTSGANAASGTVTIGSNTTKAQTFAGWTGSNGSTNQTSVTIPTGSTGNKSYTAHWTAVAGTLPTVTRTGYTCGWSTSSTGTTATYTSGGTYPTSAITESMGTTVNLYAVCTKNTYSISYTMNGGPNPSTKPTSVTYDTDVQISNPGSKTVTITGNVNSTGATIGNATTATQTFAGWTSTTVGSNAKTGTAANPTTAWTGSSTKNTYFRNLRESGTVTMVANWNTAATTLPTVTKKGHTCAWYSTSGTSGGSKIGDSGASYTPGATSASSITIYARCTANTFTVKYDCGAGTKPSGTLGDQSVVYGNSITIAGANTCTRTGYKHTKWADPTGDVSWTGWSGTWSYDNGQYGITNRVLTLTAQYTGNTYTATFYYYNGSAVTSTTAQCTVSSGTSCSATIPSAVRSSTGSYGSAYAGLNTSTGSMTESVAASTTTITLSANATYYAIYRSAVSIYRPTSASACDATTTKFYRNQWLTSTTAISTPVLSTSTTGTSNGTVPVVSGYTFKELRTAAAAGGTAYSVADAAKTTTTTFYTREAKDITVTGTFYYYSGSSVTNKTANGTATVTLHCTSTTVAGTVTANKTAATIPSEVRSSTGSYGSAYAGLSTGTGNMTKAVAASTTTVAFTANTSYYAIYRSAVNIYRPTSASACNATTTPFYRNQWLKSTTAIETPVLSTSTTGTTNGTVPVVSGYTFKELRTGTAATGTAYSVENAAKTTTTTFYARETKDDTITGTFYYNNNTSTCNSTSIKSATANGAITTTLYCSSASATGSSVANKTAITIPSAVRSSKGTLNTTYIGLNTSTGSMSASVASGTQTVAPTKNTTYYAIYQTTVTINKPTSASVCDSSTKLYRNQWFTSTTALATTVLASSATGTSNASLSSGVSGYSITGYATGASSNTSGYNSVAAMATDTSCNATYYMILNKSITGTFYYSKSAAGVKGSVTGSGTQYIRCKSASAAEISNTNFTVPSLTSEVVPTGTAGKGWATGASSMSTVTPTTANTSFYKVYGKNVSIVRPSAASGTNSCATVTAYRNAYYGTATNYTIVVATSATGTSNMTSISGLLGTFKGYSTSANTAVVTSGLTTVAASIVGRSETTYYAISNFNNSVTGTFYYSKDANGTVGSVTASANQVKNAYCTNATTATSNVQSEGTYSPSVTGEVAPSGTTRVSNWAGANSTMSTGAINTSKTKYYAVYRSALKIYYPSSATAVSNNSTLLYRNAYLNTASPTVGTTKYTTITGTSSSTTTQATSLSISGIYGTFAGLATAANSITYYAVNNANVVTSSVTTYYAVSTGTKYSVTFNVNGNGGSNQTLSCTTKIMCASQSAVGTDCSIKAPTITAASGFTAIGWSSKNPSSNPNYHTSDWNAGATNAHVDTLLNGATSATYYAQSKKTVTYTLTFNRNGATSINGGTANVDKSCSYDVFNGAAANKSCAVTAPTIVWTDHYRLVWSSYSDSLSIPYYYAGDSISINANGTMYAYGCSGTTAASCPSKNSGSYIMPDACRLTLSASSGSVAVGGTKQFTITTNCTGLSVVSPKPAVATASLNNSTKVVTLTGVSNGTVKIEVIGTGNGGAEGRLYTLVVGTGVTECNSNVTITELSNPTCTNNVGLCNDPLVSGRKVYRGASVNNYIKFANKTWRIMAVEPDGKMMLIDLTGGIKLFDTTGSRTGTQSGTGSSFCSSQASTYSCSAWSNFDPTDGTTLKGGKKSSLNTYLNSTYYSTISDYADLIAKNMPVGNGSSYSYGDLENWYNSEQRYTSSETVRIMSVSDVFRASVSATSKTSCNNKTTCLAGNWLTAGAGSKHYWVLNPSVNNGGGYKTMIKGNESTKTLSDFILQANYSVDKYYFPVIYLQEFNDIIAGSGTAADPYIVKTEDFNGDTACDPKVCNLASNSSSVNVPLSSSTIFSPNSVCSNITVTSANTSIATATYNSSTGKITVQGKVKGTTTITVKATSYTNSVTERTYTVNVYDPNEKCTIEFTGITGSTITLRNVIGTTKTLAYSSNTNCTNIQASVASTTVARISSQSTGGIVLMSRSSTAGATTTLTLTGQTEYGTVTTKTYTIVLGQS